jgi:hypothetical protein
MSVSTFVAEAAAKEAEQVIEKERLSHSSRVVARAILRRVAGQIRSSGIVCEVLADGSSRTLSEAIDFAMLSSLATRDDALALASFSRTRRNCSCVS